MSKTPPPALSARAPEPAAPPAAPRPARAARPGGTGAVTLAMVAERAGVSASTVSRILNGSAGVVDVKRAAVEEAIATLGFVPNPVARGLAGGRTMSIGVLTQSVDSPFYGVALRGIEQTLDAAGYMPLFVSGHWDADAEARGIELLRGRRVDGLIVLAGRIADAALRQTAQALPLVVTGREIEAPGLVALNFDNVQGGRLATEHLLALGHRHIAVIGGDPLHPDANERLQGHCEALAAAGIPYDPALTVNGLFYEEGGLAAIEQLLDAGPTFSAVFAANDQMAYGAMIGLRRRGLRVPEDVSIVGFDDLAASRYSYPPLTTVHHPAHELGVLATEVVLGLLQGQRVEAVVPAPQVVVRESTRRLR